MGLAQAIHSALSSRPDRRKALARQDLGFSKQLGERVFVMANGQIRSLNETRSGLTASYSSAVMDQYGQYDDYTVAQAYATGLTAWACTNVRATILSEIPLSTIDENGEKVEAGPANFLIENSSRLLWWIDAALNIWGRAYLRKRYNGFGKPTVLEWINPLDVTEYRKPRTDEIEYYRIVGLQEPLGPAQMIRFNLFNPLSDVNGLSPFEISMKRIKAEVAIADWAGSFFMNSARPDGVLVFEGDIDEDEYDRVKTEWSLFKGAKNAFKTFIAAASGGKWSWEPITPNPIDLAMKEFIDIVRSDICAAFQVSPSLIGVGTAADPLSVQSTYDSTWQQHIHHVAIPRIELLCEALNGQWIIPDFWPILEKKIKIIPNLAPVMSITLATSDRSTTSQNNLLNHVWGVNESRRYVGSEPLKNHIDFNPDWALSLYEGGVITRSQAQLAVGVSADLENDGYIFEVDPRQGGGTAPQGPTDGLFLAAGAEQRIDEKDLRSACLMLSLKGHPELIELQRKLKTRYADSALNWSDPDAFHITLVYAPVATEEQIATLKSFIDEYDAKPLTVNVGSLASFDNLGEHAIHFRIKKNQALLALQEAGFNAFTEAGIQPSQYSIPTSYKPHVTMGYTKSKMKVTTFDSKLRLMPFALQLSVGESDNYEIVGERALTSESRVDFVKETVDELINWKKRIKKKGPSVRFDFTFVDDELVDWVRASLAAGWNEHCVFDSAIRATKDGEAPQVGASQEEFKEYWRNFDEINTDLGSMWLDFHKSISPILLESAMKSFDDSSADLSVDLTEFEQAFADSLIGTRENPGPIAQLFLAGAYSGNESIKKNKIAKPRAVELDVDWDVISEEALEFLDSYKLDLIKDLSTTTKDQIITVIRNGIELGWDSATVNEKLKEILVVSGEVSERVEQRAKLIGDTESIKAFNSGAFNRWNKAGVKKAVWRTTNDQMVCPVCRELNGKEAPIGEGWYSRTLKRNVKELAHPGCRCFRRPVID